MNLLLRTRERALVSLSLDELSGLCNALNEVCNGLDIPEASFATRLGVDRALLLELLRQLSTEPPSTAARYEQVDVWAEPASVMLRAVTVFGGPVELGTDDAEGLPEQLRQAIAAAS